MAAPNTVLKNTVLKNTVLNNTVLTSPSSEGILDGSRSEDAEHAGASSERGARPVALAQLLTQVQLSYVEELLAERRVLLLGLHRAPSVAELASRCGELVVVDPSPSRIRSRKACTRSEQVSWLVADLEDTGLAGGSFEAILGFDLNLTGPEGEGILQELRRLLHPEGFLVLSLPGPGRRVLEPLSAAPVPDILSVREQVRSRFPQVELLFEQSSLAVQISTRLDALPTWQAPVAERSSLIHSYLLLCSHLEIELETQALSSTSLQPILESLRSPARRLTRQLAETQLQLEQARIAAGAAERALQEAQEAAQLEHETRAASLADRQGPGLPLGLERTGPTADLPSSSPRGVSRTSVTIDGGTDSSQSLFLPDEETLHDGPPAPRSRASAAMLADLQAQLQALKDENLDLRLELQESDGALNASERIRRDQIEQLRSTTRLLEQQLEEHGRLQELYALLQADHAQLRGRFEEIEARLSAPEEESDPDLDESSQPLVSERSFPPLEITNDPIIEALAPSARSALRKQRIYFERKLTREQLKVWELEEQVQALQTQVRGAEESRSEAGFQGGAPTHPGTPNPAGAAEAGGATRRPTKTKAVGASSSTGAEVARVSTRGSFELGTIPGGLEADLDPSISVDIPASRIPKEAPARARRPIGSPLTAAAQTPSTALTAQEDTELAGALPPGTPSTGAGTQEAARQLTAEIMNDVFPPDLEALIPGARPTPSRLDTLPGGGPRSGDAPRSGAELPGRLHDLQGRETGADVPRGSVPPAFNPPPVEPDAFVAVTPQERARGVPLRGEPARLESVPEKPAPRETPFETGLDVLPEVQAPTPPRRRQVGDPLAASFHFLDADVSGPFSADDSAMRRANPGANDLADPDSSADLDDSGFGDSGLPPLPPIPRPPEEVQRALMEDWDALPSKPQSQSLAWNAPANKGSKPAPLLAEPAREPRPPVSEDGTVSFLLEEEEERPAQSRREARARAQARSNATASAASGPPARVSAPPPTSPERSGARQASGPSSRPRPADGAQALLEALSQQSLRDLPSIAVKAPPDRLGNDRTGSVVSGGARGVSSERSGSDGAAQNEPVAPSARRTGARGPSVPASSGQGQALTRSSASTTQEFSSTLEESFFQEGEGSSGRRSGGRRRSATSPVTLPRWSGSASKPGSESTSTGSSPAVRNIPRGETEEEVPQPLMQRFLTRFWK